MKQISNPQLPYLHFFLQNQGTTGWSVQTSVKKWDCISRSDYRQLGPLIWHKVTINILSRLLTIYIHKRRVTVMYRLNEMEDVM